MAVWSSFALKNISKLNLSRSFSFFKNSPKRTDLNNVPVRWCHPRTFQIKNSEFLFRKFKDLLTLYFLVGAIPLVGIILYSEIFIGPATLALIPEGYDPKPWEYYEHPITRFFARIIPSHQECHERNLHSVFKENELKAVLQLKSKVEELIKERQDYQAWYFVKPTTKYSRQTYEEVEEFTEKQAVVSNWAR